MNKMIITGFRFKDNSGYHIYYVSTEINDPKGFIMVVDADYIITNIEYRDIDFLRILWKIHIKNNHLEPLNTVHHNTVLGLDEIYENFKRHVNFCKNQTIKDIVHNILERLGDK